MALTQVTTDVIANNTISSSDLDPNIYFPGRNRIINGAMEIDQRNAGASVTPASGDYTLDRFQAFSSASSKYSVQRSTTAPSGFVNSLLVTSLAATSVAAGDYYMIEQKIEGLNVADLAWGTVSAKTVTLSFQVYSSLTGTFGGAILNSASNRSYPFTYSVGSANTWTSVSVTIPGDTSGTWLTTNGVGLYISFSLGMGSTYSGTAGSWAGAQYWSATGATSVVGTNGATWYITGVQLEAGSVATSFERRQYGQELALCQRYYWQRSLFNYNSTTAVWEGYYGGGTGVLNVPLPVTMRASPTLTVDAPTQVQVYESTGWTDRTIAAQYSTADFVQFNVNSTSHSHGKLLQLTGGSTAPTGKMTSEL